MSSPRSGEDDPPCGLLPEVQLQPGHPGKAGDCLRALAQKGKLRVGCAGSTRVEQLDVENSRQVDDDSLPHLRKVEQSYFSLFMSYSVLQPSGVEYIQDPFLPRRPGFHPEEPQTYSVRK